MLERLTKGVPDLKVHAAGPTDPASFVRLASVTYPDGRVAHYSHPEVNPGTAYRFFC